MPRILHIQALAVVIPASSSTRSPSQSLSFDDLITSHPELELCKFMLGLLQTLSCCQVEPFVGLHVILRHALSGIKTQAKLALAIGIALLGRFTEPLYGLNLVLGYASAKIKAPSKVELTSRIALLGRFTPMLVRLRVPKGEFVSAASPAHTGARSRVFEDGIATMSGVSAEVDNRTAEAPKNVRSLLMRVA
jgi:hypothetical protein